MVRSDALAVGDFDNDGRPDLAVTSAPNRRVEIFRRVNSGRLEPDGFVPVGSEPNMIAVADFNGDGNDDLATDDASDTAGCACGRGRGGACRYSGSPRPRWTSPCPPVSDGPCGTAGPAR